MPLGRVLRHLTTTHWSALRRFPPEVMASIEAAVREAEATHAGQIRFVVESALDLPHLWHRISPRQRAVQVFAQLGIWDTSANNGVLIYLLLAERVVEIVADRGIAARVAQPEWESICRQMEQHFRAGRFREGSTAGIASVGELLARHFPGRAADGTAPGAADALPDEPVIL